MKPGIYDEKNNLIKSWAELEKEGLDITKDCEFFKDDRYIASTILSSYNNVKLVIPDDIKYIREDAFKFCKALKTVVLGESVEEIGISAFNSCENLRNVVFNKNIKILNKGAFEWCYKLELANLPNSLTNIGKYAFCDCHNLKEIHIPASTCNIESSAFVNCENLEKIEVDTSNPKYCSKNGVLFSKDMRTLVNYPSNKEGREYIVPKTVTVLEEYSLSYNKNLEKVILPDNLKQIERWAFSNSLLKNIYIPDSTRSLGDGIFIDNEDLKEIRLPDDIELGENSLISIKNLSKIKVTKNFINNHKEFAKKYKKQIKIEKTLDELLNSNKSFKEIVNTYNEDFVK